MFFILFFNQETVKALKFKDVLHLFKSNLKQRQF